MSVTDPLLKKLKGYILAFHNYGKTIDDRHEQLEPFSETIELILRKGIRQTSSVFGMTKRDYWNWIEYVTQKKNSLHRGTPGLSMAVDAVRKCKKVTTAQSRGRQFIRLALKKKALIPAIELLIGDINVLETWYEPEYSILGNEILCEILMSLLQQLSEITFSLNTKNATFLHETWTIPCFKEVELVPCIDIGIQIQFIEGRPVVVSMEAGSVAEDDGNIEVGDVLDEVLHKPTYNIKIGQLSKTLKQNHGHPVHLAIVKCKLPDESIFLPVIHLLELEGKDFVSLQKLLDDETKRINKTKNKKPPPHAQLPEDEYEEVPVHNHDDKARYHVKFIGKVDVGQNGGVNQIEGAVNKAMQVFKPEQNLQNLENVIFELGETEVIVTSRKSNEVLFRHSYPEISSCGRKIDQVLYCAYIAGETTCTLAQNFIAYLFRCETDEDCKTMLCSIAQGFDRTHWFV